MNLRKVVAALLAIGLSYTPLRAADSKGLSWRTSLPLQLFYDSNIYHSYTRPVEDLGMRISPGVSIGYRRPAWSLGTGGMYMRERFYGIIENSGIQDRRHWEGRGSGTIRFATGLNAAAVYKFVDTEEPVFAELEQDRTPVGRRRHYLDFKIGQRLGAGRLDARIDYKFIRDLYREQVNKVLDGDRHVVELETQLKAFPKTAFFGRVETEFRRYLHPDDLITQNHNDIGLNLGATGDWSPKLSGTLMLGGKLYLFQKEGLQISPIVKLDTVYKPNGLAKLNLGYEHILADATGSLYFNIDRGRFGLARKLSRSWTFEPQAVVTLLRYSPPLPRTDLTVLTSVAFVAKPVPIPQLEINLHYGYDYRYSNVQTFQYTAQTISLSILWKID